MTLPEALEEARRRLPSIDLIGDPVVRRETAQIAARAPSYFWSVPASSSGYHHPLCRGERGLWVHTLMVSTVVERLLDSRVGLGLLEESDRDLARSAAVLHDMRKNGPPGCASMSSVSDHDLRMARVIREESSLPEAVAEAVESHMGPWYDGPAPEPGLERIVHDADMVASTSTISPAVPAPLPEELADVDGLEEVDLK